MTRKCLPVAREWYCRSGAGSHLLPLSMASVSSSLMPSYFFCMNMSAALTNGWSLKPSKGSGDSSSAPGSDWSASCWSCDWSSLFDWSIGCSGSCDSPFSVFTVTLGLSDTLLSHNFFSSASDKSSVGRDGGGQLLTYRLSSKKVT